MDIDRVNPSRHLTVYHVVSAQTFVARDLFKLYPPPFAAIAHAPQVKG